LGEVEQTIVQDRGRDVRCAAALGPEDFIGTGDIALGIQRLETVTRKSLNCLSQKVRM
jgi:hypothetical protein